MVNSATHYGKVGLVWLALAAFTFVLCAVDSKMQNETKRYYLLDTIITTEETIYKDYVLVIIHYNVDRTSISTKPKYFPSRKKLTIQSEFDGVYCIFEVIFNI